MWFFKICVTNLLGRKYQNRYLLSIIKTWYTCSIKLVLRKLGTDYYGGDAKIYFDYPVPMSTKGKQVDWSISTLLVDSLVNKYLISSGTSILKATLRSVATLSMDH